MKKENQSLAVMTGVMTVTTKMEISSLKRTTQLVQNVAGEAITGKSLKMNTSK